MSAISKTPGTKQEGAALLVFILILVMGSSYMLLRGLNDNLRANYAPQKNAEVLQVAKDALLSFAATYPDYEDLDGGPGYLPCPDRNNNGRPETNCSDGGGTTIGRLPDRYSRLGIPELRDSSGERLWYVLSENYRYGANKIVPHNSNTPGTLSVDNVSDIVAIIIAPGPPLPNQDRSGAPDSEARNDPANYLDGENADGSLVYTRSGDAEFNDQLIYITRAELMRYAEKRILGEVVQAFNTYRTALWNQYEDDDPGVEDGAYSWLSEFDVPEDSLFRATIGVRQGHIPYHWSGDKEDRLVFNSNLEVEWVLDVDDENVISDGTVSREALTDSNHLDSIFGNYSPLMVNEAECSWTAGTDEIQSHEIAVCSGQVIVERECAHPELPVCDGECRRNINFELHYSGMAEIIPPDVSSVRLRNVSWSDALSDTGDYGVNRVLIDMEDYFTSEGLCPGIINDEMIGSGELNLEENDVVAGEIMVAGIQYDLDADAGELPAWFFENEWHYMTYVSYPDSEEMPGRNDLACMPDADECLIVENTGMPNNNKRALVIASGIELDGQDRSSVADLEAYFENYFEESNNIFGLPTNDPGLRAYSGGNIGHYYPVQFNDQIRIISETNVP